GWNPGHLQRPVSRDDFSSLYLKYGVSPGNRIPLWQLVYHDCLASTWYWGDSPGWFYEIAPEISDLKDVQTILYGAMPLFWRDSHRGYDWSQNKDRWMESYYLTVKFHEAVFGEQMVSHTFVTDDRMVQKTEFKNGAVALVNFGSKNYRAELGRKELTLPPNGFHAKAPGVEQGRLVQNNTVMTFVKTKDFFYYKSTGKCPSEPLSIAGEIVLFRLDETRWNLLFKPESPDDRIDITTVGEFMGWGRFKIHPLSKDWEIKDALLSGDTDDIPLPGGAYALIKQQEATNEAIQ
ncbi:MAG: hypothetical protein KAH24_05290, partial [Holophagae bacterium]|nr:hypothetical protein [Holophagae bacterium]